MKKRVLTIFLTSIIFIATFIYMSPFSVCADSLIASEICWSINQVGTYSNVVKYPNRSGYYSKIYSYNSGTSWTQVPNQETITRRFQLPSPYANLNDVEITQSGNYSITSVSNISLIGFGFNQNLFDIIDDQLQPSSNDYIGMAIFASLESPISSLSITLGELSSGNQYVNSGVTIEDRYIQYDPSNINGGTSSIIDTSLWSVPSSTRYFAVFYFNVLYSDFLMYRSGNDKAIVLSLGLTTSSRILVCNPIIYKSSSNGETIELSYLSSINDNVQHIVDVMDSGTSFPIGNSVPDYSTMNQLEDQISSIASDSSIWTGMSDGFGSVEIIQGLAWVGSFITSYYNGLPFFKSIFALIILFEIWSILNGTFFNREQDETEWVYHTREHGTYDRFSERYKK